MDKKVDRALEIATQICVAKASSSAAVARGDTGEKFGEFFEAIYTAVLAIEKRDSTES